MVLLDLVDQFSKWSGIHLNVSKYKITAFIHALQAIPRKRDKDDALRSRHANVNMAGRSICSLTQAEPLPRGYLGTPLTASLCPDAHLRWTKEQVKKIGKALARAPLPLHIKQRLFLYGVHSKITHTHCLLALSTDDMNAVDSFPKAGPYAPNRGNWLQHPVDVGRLLRHDAPVLHANSQ
jgi:hypothetical protein